ncbi:MAG: hypothetical protein IPL45_01225 [Actinomycetales bacterium]|nr:hypothetical protein [Actinomycetales bacterium]
MRKALGLAIGITALLAAMLALFAWPATSAAPSGLPIVVAGPAPATAEVSATLAQARPGAFEITTRASRDEAIAAIRESRAYGAIVVGSTPEVLTASARSAAVAQLLGQLGTQLGASRGAPITVTDVVPAPSRDPRGAGLVAGLLPMVLAGLICAAASTMLLPRRADRLTTLLAVAALGGLTLAWLLHGWLGSLTGSFPASATVLALGITAVGLPALGLESALGHRGLGLAAVLFVLVGNALSGAASAPEMLPVGWGAFGQLLPPGAISSALRSVAFFDGAGATGPLVVLGCWAAFGAALVVVGHRRGTDVRAAVSVPDPAV